MHDRPLIGLTSNHRYSDEHKSAQLALVTSYVRAVEAAGGAPVIVPVTLGTEALAALYARLDGVLLPGGADVAASAYGAEPVPSMYGEDEARDRAEIALSQWATRDDKPLLAICRGIQVLNVALGGTLYRHIPDEFPTPLEHDHEYATQRDLLAHVVSVTPDSLLGAALGKTHLPVNSLHHQAANQVGAGLRVAARASDGLIEGLEHPDRRFIVGVQWHPEVLFEADAAMHRLFWAFAEAARGNDGWRDGQEPA